MKRSRKPNSGEPAQREQLVSRGVPPFPDSVKMPLQRGYYFPVCAESMVAALASAYLHGAISYLWACETCGYERVVNGGPLGSLSHALPSRVGPALERWR